MPAKPAYFHRVAGAIENLKSMDCDWADRRMVEELLGVSKTVAWRVLRRCGGEEGPGSALMCRREGLIAALEQLQATGELEREVRRRDRVSGYLERLAEFGRTKRTQVATDQRAVELLSSRFGELPAGIQFTPRRLTVEFSSPEEFLQRIGAIIFTLQNDYDSVRQFIESGNH
jgi:hypothetical protein